MPDLTFPPGPHRHRRRRHHGLLGRLPSGQGRRDRRRAAGAGAAHRRHHLARRRAGRAVARAPEHDAAGAVFGRALRAAGGRDRPGDRLEAMRLGGGGAHAGAHDHLRRTASAATAQGRAVPHHLGARGGAKNIRSCAPTTSRARCGCRATARPIPPTSPRRSPRARAWPARASSRRRASPPSKPGTARSPASARRAATSPARSWSTAPASGPSRSGGCAA